MSFSTEYNFSQAFLAATELGARIYRKGWNGKGMFVFSVPENKYPAARNTANTLVGMFEDDLVPYGAYLALKTADNNVVPWIPSQSDLYARDWMVTKDTVSTPCHEIQETVETSQDLVVKYLQDYMEKHNSTNSMKQPRIILVNLHEDDECELCSGELCGSENEPVESPAMYSTVFNSFTTDLDQPLPSTVTMDFLNSVIKKTKFKSSKNSSMVECRIHLTNSYIVTGSVVIDSCLSLEENEQRAYQVTFDKLWELYGYLLGMITYTSKEKLPPMATLFAIEITELVEETNFTFPIANKLTHCTLTLNSNFVVTGESACLNPDNFDAGLGRGIAYDNAMTKLTQLHDFLQIDLAYYYAPEEQ